jgi:hypothetical protein
VNVAAVVSIALIAAGVVIAAWFLWVTRRP